MRAIICEKHGQAEGLKLLDIAKPIPKEDEVLIKIYATTVLRGDTVLRQMSFLQYLFAAPFARIFFGIRNMRKKTLGHEFAGIIEAVGKEVSAFVVGDEVFGITGFQGGAYAEYVCLEETAVLTQKPSTLSFTEAAALPVGGIAAVYFLREAGITAGQKVLIYGASGSIGTYAVQVAKYFEVHVTGVCSTRNVNLVKELGADAVIDYTQTDYTQLADRYDIIFDTVGKTAEAESETVLKPGGKFISTHASPMEERLEDLIFIKELVEQGAVKPVIDHVYALEEVVEAHKYVEKGHKIGNVVLKID